VICHLVRSCQSQALFEIGTFDGKTTLHLAANASSDAKVFTLDLPQSDMAHTDLRILSGERIFVDKDKSGSAFAESPFQAKITQLFGDSATFDFTPFVDRTDFVFIDGSHSYEYVVNDTLIALKLLRGGKGNDSCVSSC
jgi:hypothetical protein